MSRLWFKFNSSCSNSSFSKRNSSSQELITKKKTNSNILYNYYYFSHCTHCSLLTVRQVNYLQLCVLQLILTRVEPLTFMPPFSKFCVLFDTTAGKVWKMGNGKRSSLAFLYNSLCALRLPCKNNKMFAICSRRRCL